MSGQELQANYPLPQSKEQQMKIEDNENSMPSSFQHDFCVSADLSLSS
jgi:hypothetical protein